MESVKQVRCAKCYEFGPFVVDVAKSILLRDGEIVPIGLKAFEALLVLIQHQGEVLMKDELMREVWPDTIVEENNLARTISALRKALDDHMDAPQYIATISGRGYRFVAGVKEISKEHKSVGELAQEYTNGQPIIAKNKSPIAPTIPALSNEYLLAQLRYYKLGLLAVIGLMIVGVIVAFVIPHLRQKAQVSLPRKLWQLSFDPGLESEPTWSPDGRLIAYSSDRSGNFDIWTQPVGEGNPVRVTTSPAHDWQAD